jgi:putative ABC transport system permease protein
VDATPGWGLAVAVVVLTGAAVLVARAGRIGSGRDILVAAARAVLQLGVVSSVLVLVLERSSTTAGFVALMLGVAAVTSARRIAPETGLRGWPLLPIAAGALPALGVALATGAVPLETVSVLPIAGILIGGAMTATSLTGAQVRAQLSQRWGEYEAGLAIGLSVRDSTIEVVRPSVALALVPAIDQTRTVGLVTLPGAFVGVLLGGGTAVQAGSAQLLVLVGILAAQVVATVVTTELVARSQRLLGPLHEVRG